jgi:hypothetical protein
MAIVGLRNTTNFITNQRPENWREAILLLYPNAGEGSKAPLTALTSLMQSEKTDDPTFHWWEKEFEDRRYRLTSAITNVATSIPIDTTYRSDGSFSIKIGDMILLENTGEIVRVVSTPTVNTAITVVRAQGGTSNVAIDPTLAGVNPFMTVIGSAFEEGSVAPDGVSWDPVERVNYCQIFRSALEITRTAQKTRLRTGDAVKEARRECLEYFSVDMERAFWFGRGVVTTLNGRPLRYTDGVVRQITARAPNNVVAVQASGALSMLAFEQFLLTAFAFGSSEKMAFCSNRTLMALQQCIRKNSQFQVQTGIKEYGMQVMRIISPFGTLVLKPHPLFNQMVQGTTAGTAYNAVENNLYVLDMKYIKYRYVDDVMPQGNLQAIGQDALKSGFLAECGIELNMSKAHAILTGIKTGIIDP